MIKVANKKAIGQVVMEQNNYGVQPNLCVGENEGKALQLSIE